ncbi:hypothetical protein [Natronococcus sp.]|uniref:hypothetical protein n=1 Tax=Natronococcus sp. TaxID=35747 RepID=UPI003A4E0F73
MVGTFTVDLRNGRSVPFDEIVVLERTNGTWIRCIRDEPSRREQLPETTKYYHLETDVVALLEETDDELTEDETVRRSLE